MRRIYKVFIVAMTAMCLFGCGNRNDVEVEEIQEEIYEIENINTPFNIENLNNIEVLISFSYYEPEGWRKRERDDRSAIIYYPYEKNADGFIVVGYEKEVSNFKYTTFIKNMVGDGKLMSSHRATMGGLDAYCFRYNKYIEDILFDEYSYVVPCEKHIYCASILIPNNLSDEQIAYFEKFVKKTAITEKPYAKDSSVPSSENTDKLAETSMWNKDDFFSDTSRYDNYYALCKSGKYKEIYELVDDYINTYSPNKKDTAYLIKNWLEPVIQVWDRLEVNYDKVEDVTYYYFKGVTDISDKVHIVPYVSSNNGVNCSIGFKEADWIFFDRVIITTDSDNIEERVNHLDKTEVVLSHGIVEEKMNFSDIKQEEMISISESSESIIRFKGDDEKYYDYKVSEKEKEALNVISKMYNLRMDLSNIQYAYKNELEYDFDKHWTKKK